MDGLTEGGKKLLHTCIEGTGYARMSMNVIERVLTDPDAAKQLWDISEGQVHHLDASIGVVASDYPLIKAHLMLTGHWKVT